MLVGYARISTEDQKLDLQMDALKRAGIEDDRIYTEQVSGVKTRRPQLSECIKSLREGDTLVVWRLDRLGRSLPELIKIMTELQDKGVGFRSLNESIDTTSAVGKMIFHMLGAVAQFERDLISERTRAGLKAARKRGHRGGRPPKVTAKMLKAAKSMLGDETTTMQEVADTLNVSRAAIYRAMKRENEAKVAKDLKKASKRVDHTALSINN
jgi:DNA invertase Pin-like site-specific DNA recombinase